jgi:hypothetical protein
MSDSRRFQSRNKKYLFEFYNDLRIMLRMYYLRSCTCIKDKQLILEEKTTCRLHRTSTTVFSKNSFRRQGSPPSRWPLVRLTDPKTMLSGREIAFRPTHKKSSANFVKSLSNFTKTSMQHSAQGSLEVIIKFCLRL